MSSVTTSSSIDITCEALLRCADQVADLLRRIGDPTPRAIGIWNIAETATHLALSSPFFLAVARGEVEPEDITDNAATTVRAVAEEAERDLERLADRIVAGESALAAYARSLGSDGSVSPFRGITFPMSTMLGVELGELIVHGFDMARAAGMPWHVDPVDAALALAAEVQVLPIMLDEERAEGLRLGCRLHIRHGSTVDILIEDGRLRVEPPGAVRVDCHLTVDPMAFLILSFHRIGQTGPLLTGKVISWGRRPWAAPRLQSVLTSV
jgi:uncharacterized damage-inducible protein DinB